MKIGIVNDLPLAVEALRRALQLRTQHQVIWVAGDGAEAVARCQQETPDLVLMDLLMPGMDGVEATRRIMASTPCAILIVTVNVGTNASHVFEAMGCGALDAIDTPSLGVGDPNKTAAPFLTKIDTINQLLQDRGGPPMVHKATAVESDVIPNSLVAIGASAGGPAALVEVLRRLPKDFPATLIIVQHVDQQFAPGMVDWLNLHSALPVRLIEEGARPTVGTALFAGTNDHLILKSSTRLGYTTEPHDSSYRPSVDVFFESVKERWRGVTIGVLLTGMGSDGAIGLKTLRDSGCHTIAQDRASSAVYGMPKAAATLGAAVDILPVDRIAEKIVNVLAGKG